MATVDVLVFVAFVAIVITVGLLKSRAGKKKEHGAQDYFLAGRGLTWWLVGFSLIAANISSEQFVGMSGKASDWLGIAIASYEWMAAVTLVAVAFLFLPTFLKSGIYTIPEFLEYRYNSFARIIMAISTMIILVGVPTASVIYSGAKVICVFFQGEVLLGLDLGNITVGCWIIAVMAAVYVFAGGLKACAWADLIQGAALILGGVIITYLVFRALGIADPKDLAAAGGGKIDINALSNSGPLGRFAALNSGPLPDGKLHMFRPATDPEIPWTALIIGMWIPHFFYWGLNQYITQRTLGSKSLDEGQKGIVFAAFLKLIVPFVVVIPGMLAFNLYHEDLAEQADKKNEPIIAELEAGAQKVFIFDEDFADLHPDITMKIIVANKELLHVSNGPAATDTATLTAFNDTLEVKAKTEKATLSNRLVGRDHDAAFPTLLRNLLPKGKGLMGFVLAAIFGAVVSSLASMLNSASTIFTMDIFRKLKKNAPEKQLVTVGRISTIVFVLIAVSIAPSLDNPAFGGIFTFIQEFQGFISPGILAIFLFGLLVKKAPRMAGTVGLVLNPILYGAFKVALPSLSFLNRMALCFGIVLAVLAVITALRPLEAPVTLPVNNKMNLETSKSTKIFGIAVILLTILLYAVFF